jgi:hypothetical protein
MEPAEKSLAIIDGERPKVSDGCIELLFSNEKATRVSKQLPV